MLARNGIRQEVSTNFNGKVWRNVNGFWNKVAELYEDNNSNIKEERSRGIDWAICYDRGSRNGDRLAKRYTKIFEPIQFRKTI